ncbi:DUF1007 family protein [Curvivirga sp.]|uniref:DUF1007 family protein n=1 Tax=Curvivirga sp. TaxID=2856848 RepID=UPI003B58E24E
MSYAHPHAWIDLQSSVVFNDEGQVEGLKLRWTFDALYTGFALSGVKRDEDGNLDKTFINELAKENLTNLEDYSYFTFMDVAGEKQNFETVTEFSTDIDDGRLWLEFNLPLPEALDPKDITYSVYDPTYYIEILHKDRLIAFEGNQTAEENCSYDFTDPEPTEELISRMADLDKTETAGNGVGQFFAEKVSVTCF